MQRLEERTLPSALGANLQNAISEKLADVQSTVSSLTSSAGPAGNVVSSALSGVQSLFSQSAAPVITGFASPVSFTEGGGAVTLDDTATVTDSDTTNFGGAVLKVAITDNRSISDRLSIENEGTGSGQVGTDGHEVTFEGTVVGHFYGGQGFIPLFVVFKDGATVDAVQAVMQHVTFNNTSDNPSTDTRTFSVRLTDGAGGVSDEHTNLIDVTAVNDAPTVSNFSNTVSYKAGGSAAFLNLFPGLKDPDTKKFDGATLTTTLTANGQSTDKLSIRSLGWVSVDGSNIKVGGKTVGTFTGGTGTTPLVVTFNSDATRWAVQLVMRHITFESTASSPSTSPRTAQIVLTDGDGGTSTAVTTTIDVST